MTIIETILLVINIISFGFVVIMLPLGIYEYFAGKERAETFIKKIGVTVSYRTIEILYLICLVLALVTYILRDSIFR